MLKFFNNRLTQPINNRLNPIISILKYFFLISGFLRKNCVDLFHFLTDDYHRREDDHDQHNRKKAADLNCRIPRGRLHFIQTRMSFVVKVLIEAAAKKNTDEAPQEDS